MSNIKEAHIRSLFHEIVSSSDANDLKRLKVADRKVHDLLLKVRHVRNLDPLIKRALMKLKNAHTLANRKMQKAAFELQHQIRQQSGEIERAQAYVNVLDLSTARRDKRVKGLIK